MIFLSTNNKSIILHHILHNILAIRGHIPADLKVADQKHKIDGDFCWPLVNFDNPEQKRHQPLTASAGNFFVNEGWSMRVAIVND